MMIKTVPIFFISSILLLSACGLLDSEKKDETTTSLHPIMLNSKWGFIRNNGSIAINPEFDEARFVSNGYATFRKATYWGVISEATESITKTAEFSQIGVFDGELAPAKLSGENYGFINASGTFLINKDFEVADRFSEDRAAVLKDGLWAYINRKGETVIGYNFSQAGRFSEGLAAVQTADGWKYIDVDGATVLSPAFRIAYAGLFSEKLAPVQTTEGWGYINEKGALTIPVQFDEAYPFSQGLARVKLGDYYGFISTDGTIEIEPQFSGANDFKENFAAVRMGNLWFYISKSNGKIAFNMPEQIRFAEDFQNGIARVQINTDENARFGYINTDGEYVWYPSR
jgi:hypothetical protein